MQMDSDLADNGDRMKPIHASKNQLVRIP